ncbi:MAG: IS21 family transposase, partial [Planctomycetota bacterium]
ETLDKPALRPLPPTRYEFATWSQPRVNIDYHVEIDKHYYSVPFHLLQQQVDARATATTVEIFFKGRRVASHRRSYTAGRHTTIAEHMPRAHREHLEWTPSRILQWAGKTGPQTAALAQKILQSKAHPEQGYRACLGLLRLGQKYGADRLEAACTRALMIDTCSYRSVKSILERGLDRVPLPNHGPDGAKKPIDHDNIRGSEYYQ